MLRTSSYTIYVPLADPDEGTLLVHGYTGAYDRVSRGVAEYLRSLEAGPPAEPLHGTWQSEPALAPAPAPAAISDRTVEILHRRGYMTEMSVQEEEGYLARLVKKRHQRDSRAVSYIIMPTYNCNLRCAYCFQDHMRTQPEYAH
ncbi:MAG: radical SAM protein, partial [Gemmatimonadetes bacterium]|nr:radical SAM protein [Gemmatimonadota bacterium]